MTALALVALALAAVVPLVPVRDLPGTASTRSPIRIPAPWWSTIVVAVAALAVAGIASVAIPEPVTGIPVVFGSVLTVFAAATGGAVVAPAVFHLARRETEVSRDANRGHHGAPDTTNPPREDLRGGLTIGVLERVAVATSVLTGWPEGIAVVLAVKGLARYPEVRDAHASEYFIIGTFTSVLWALAAGGVGVGLTN